MIEEFVSVTDIAGYNYLTALHEAEKQRASEQGCTGYRDIPCRYRAAVEDREKQSPCDRRYDMDRI